MESGSSRAKLLKLADRISNLVALGYVHDRAFVEKILDETRECILPFSHAISADMDRELRDLVGLLQNAATGDTVDLEVIRGRRRMTGSLTLR